MLGQLISWQHVGILTRTYVRNAVRGGAGLVFLVVLAMVGLGIASAVVDPISKTIEDLQKQAGAEVTEEEVAEQMLAFARPALGWWLGSLVIVVASLAARSTSARVVGWAAVVAVLQLAPPQAILPAPPRLVVLDVGHGDAFVVQGREHRPRHGIRIERHVTGPGAGPHWEPEHLEELERKVLVLQHAAEAQRRAAEEDMDRIVEDVRIRVEVKEGTPAPEAHGATVHVDTPGTEPPPDAVFVPEMPEPQVFLLEVDVIADAITVVDTRDVYFLVPPSGTDPGEIECS